MEKFEGKCVYCANSDNLTIDHIVPFNKGGENKKDNLQLCCGKCNRDKSDMTHDDYLAKRKCREENRDLGLNVTFKRKRR